MGVLRKGPLREGLRAAAPLRDEDTRGLVTAERAVAPFAIEFGGDPDREEDGRREAGGVARPLVRGGAVVAMNV